MPLPDAPPERAVPAGHSGRDATLLSGRLRVSFEARTPVLVRGFGSADAPAVPSRPAASGGREEIIPGSAVHGAVRALHEAATGSCLRVFDGDFVPCYRQSVTSSGTDDLRLAVVKTPPPGDGSAGPVLRLCESGNLVRHRLHQDELERLHQRPAQPDGLRSGDRLRVSFDAGGKASGGTVDPTGEWVVFISDSGAREAGQPYRAAIRKLGDTTVTVPAQVWADYLEVVDGADDLRPARLEVVPEEQRFTDVEHTYAPKGGPERVITVGRRCLARKAVHIGQPLWIRLDGGQVTQVQLAIIWRKRGARSAAERAGEHTSCWDPKELCPSCRLFGSADTRGEVAEKGRAFQRSYRGHVRCGDALAAPAVRTVAVTLPPMGAPKPGAGQFYLANSRDVAGDIGDPPLREWGSAADPPGTPRTVRGRKFYWHTTVADGALPRRGQAGVAHDGNAMVSKAVAYRAGSVFTATVTFTDITRAQLAGLLVALCPRLCFGPDAVTHLGGGRPLGYGSCSTTIDTAASWWTSAEDRYRGRPPSTPDDAELDALAAEFAATMPGTLRDALGTVLRMGAVPEREVGYPPGDPFSGDDEAEVAFEFWRQSSGFELKLTKEDKENGVRRRGYPLIPLPDLGDDPRLSAVREAQSQPIQKNSPTSRSSHSRSRGRSR